MSNSPLIRHNRLNPSEDGVYSLDDKALFAYSEGEEAETYLREVFKNARDLSIDSDELQEKIRDWSSEYHLSPERTNLLRGLVFPPQSRVMELGCGCGIISRCLGEKGLLVDAVEGSRPRVELAQMRCRELDNVAFIHSNFNQLDFPDASYDAIFLIGVLEYASLFLDSQQTSGEEASLQILRRLKKALKPGGVIVVAIENRLGLKYWLGATEDHYIRRDLGLLNYPVGGGITTFDRRQWSQLIAGLGQISARFLLPFPDYKLPRVILDEGFAGSLDNAESFLHRITSRDPCSDWEPGAEELLRWKGLCASDYLGDFSNSYLILLSEEQQRLDQVAPYDFQHYSSTRRKAAFRTITCKGRHSGRVQKEKLQKSAVDTPLQGQQASQRLADADFINGRLLSTDWLEACYHQDQWQTLSGHLAKYSLFLQEQGRELVEEQGSIDLLPSNILIGKNLENSGEEPADFFVQWKVIDQEWYLPQKVSLSFVFFRALLWFGVHNRELLFDAGRPVGIYSIGDFIVWGFDQVGLPTATGFEKFLSLETEFHNHVLFGDEGFDAAVFWSWPLDQSEVPAMAESVTHPVSKGPIFNRLRRKIKRSVQLVLTSIRNSHYQRLKASGIFSPDYYLQQNKDVNGLEVDPLVHYVKYGWQERRSFSPLFDTGWYCQQNSIPENQDPLLHYIEKGWQQGKNPFLFFHSTWYAETYPEALDEFSTPLGHFLVKGCQSGYRPNPVFDPQYYLQQNQDVCEAGINPLFHYTYAGSQEGRSPAPFFDVAYYLEDNPTVARLGMNPLEHYFSFGAAEGRSPHRLFDPQYYRQDSDPQEANSCEGFASYLTDGWQQKRPNALFDPLYYRETYPEFEDSHDSAMLHYYEHGIFLQHYPCREVAALENKPLISIITPVYNTDPDLLIKCIHSVLYQPYPLWELCLVDDGSITGKLHQILLSYSRRDPRIKIWFLGENVGIARASNICATMASGEYLAFLDHDDELSHDALFEVVKAINEHQADVLYCDEELVNLESRRLDLFHKPLFNEELLLCHNYITHFVVLKSRLFREVGGFTAQYSGAQDYDLLLKVTEKTKKVVHLPQILYKWRAHANSTSVNHLQKDYADEAGRKALAAALDRRGIAGKVMSGAWKYFYRVKRDLSGHERVALIMPFTSMDAALSWYARIEPWLDYDRLEVHLVLYGKLAGTSGTGVNTLSDQRVTIHCKTGCTTYPEACNAGAECSLADHLIFLGPDLVPLETDWISSLLEYSQLPGYGPVSGYIGDEGDDPVEEQSPAETLREVLLVADRNRNNLHCQQGVFAASWECMMVKRELFKACKGLDHQQFCHTFFDLDFCLRARERGLNAVYTPYARFKRIRLESDALLADDMGTRELQLFKKQWQVQLDDYKSYLSATKAISR